MDKYEQFEIEQRALMRALEADGPSETLAARLKALYRDAGVVIALGPSRAVPRDEDEDRPADDLDPDALPMADDRDMDYYIRALDSGALTPIFAHAPWGEVSLRYEALVMDDKVCPASAPAGPTPWRFWRRERRTRGSARELRAWWARSGGWCRRSGGGGRLGWCEGGGCWPYGMLRIRPGKSQSSKRRLFGLCVVMALKERHVLETQLVRS
jgi:hypothetical protein